VTGDGTVTRDRPAEMGASQEAGAPPTDRWWWWITGAVAVGLAVRVASILLWMDPSPLSGDGRYYHYGANLLATGHGFVQPIFHSYSFGAVQQPGAAHPPAYLVFLSGPSLLGLRTPLEHQIWSALLGCGSIVVMALLGREIAGRRAGLIAAAVVAVYPNFFLLDGLLQAETLLLFTVALATLLAYRLLRRPRLVTAVALGAVCGLATLTRAEQLLLLPLLALPAAYIATPGPWTRRVGAAALSVAAGLAVITPWSIYNQTRFEKPVPLTTSAGLTLAVSNCNPTYYHRDQLGSWSFSCFDGIDLTKEPSVADAEARDRALRYARDHADRLPVVLLARLGRMWGFYRPGQTINLGHGGRPYRLLQAGHLAYYLTAAGAVAGAVVLRRRRVAVWPMVVHVAIGTFVALVFYGTPRFRVGAEVAFVAVAAVAFDALWSHLEGRRTTAAAQGRPARRRQAASSSPSGVEAGASSQGQVSRPIRCQFAVARRRASTA